MAATLYDLVCEQCGVVFIVASKYRYKRYCGKTCKLKHTEKPKHPCKQCNSPTHNKFCSRSCAASFNNSIRTKESREKQRQSVTNTFFKKYENYKYKENTKSISKNKKRRCKSYTERLSRPLKIGSRRWWIKEHAECKELYSRVYYNTCKHSGEIFISKSPCIKYSPKYKELYSQNGRARFQFTFKITDYPELFDLSLIEKHGWFSVGGKCGIPVNKEGVSRDHRVSVNEAIRNNYDPYYIKHPLNCELMLHRDNMKKKTESSLTYEELKFMIDSYEMLKRGE